MSGGYIMLYCNMCCGKAAHSVKVHKASTLFTYKKSKRRYSPADRFEPILDLVVGYNWGQDWPKCISMEQHLVCISREQHLVTLISVNIDFLYLGRVQAL